MNYKRKFLLPLATLVGAFSSENAPASIPNQPRLSDSSVTDQNTIAVNDTVKVGSHDLFKFVLRRDGNGVMVADHESHYSHESHSSHSSHSSHYSGS